MTPKNRALELKRQANVADIESACLLMKVGKSQSFEVIDLQTQQRLKMRLSRLKNMDNVKMDFETELVGNKVIVTRKS